MSLDQCFEAVDVDLDRKVRRALFQSEGPVVASRPEEAIVLKTVFVDEVDQCLMVGGFDVEVDLGFPPDPGEKFVDTGNTLVREFRVEPAAGVECVEDL